MGTEFIRARMVMNTEVNGTTTNVKASGSSRLGMEMCMKASSKATPKVELVFIISLTENVTSATTKMMLGLEIL